MEKIYVVTADGRPVAAFSDAERATHFCSIQTTLEKHRFRQRTGCEGQTTFYNSYPLTVDDKYECFASTGGKV